MRECLTIFWCFQIFPLKTHDQCGQPVLLVFSLHNFSKSGLLVLDTLERIAHSSTDSTTWV
jgi:hypothetical protein